jgi:hypothetical protein
MLPHQSANALLLHSQRLDKAPVGPNMPIAPEEMLSFQHAYMLQQAFMALGNRGRGLPAHPSTSSLFFSSRARPLMGVFNWAFSLARRA